MPLFESVPGALAWSEGDVRLFGPHPSRWSVGWSAASIALHQYQDASSLASARKEASRISRSALLLEIEDNKFDCVQECGHYLKPSAPRIRDQCEPLKCNTSLTCRMWVEVLEADDRRPGATGSGFSNQPKEERHLAGTGADF